MVESTGKIAVHVGSSAIGQGLETVCAQIAADALQLPMDDIAGVFHGSTDDVREGYGSYSSRSVVMGGNAIGAAAEKLREAIRTAAAERWSCAANEVEIDAGMARGPAGRSLPLGTFAGTSAEAAYVSNKRTYSYGAHAAHVAVDPKTGHVELIDYVAVEDVGRIINPLTLHGQAVGAIVQGLGGAFLEHFGMAPGSRGAYAFTFLDYQEAAHRYGRMGGYAHLKTLIDRLRAQVGAGNSVLLDGGDAWRLPQRCHRPIDELSRSLRRGRAGIAYWQ